MLSDDPTMLEVLVHCGLRSEPHPLGYPRWRLIYRGEKCYGEISTPELWRRWHAREEPFT